MESSNQTVKTPIKSKISRPLLKRLYRSIAHYSVTIIDVIGIILTVSSILWLLGGEGNFITWYFVSLVPGILVLSPFIAMIGLITRRRWFFFHIFPTIMFGMMYGIMFIPRAPDVPANTPQLRVMTFNTQFKSEQAPEIARIILEADADVIALQELVQPTADYLAAHLADEYPYQISRISPDYLTQGKGLLSRYPLNDIEYDTLNNQVNYIRAQIEFEGEVITIVTTHPSPPSWGRTFNSSKRSRHIDWIMEKLTQESGAIVILGDFNTTDQSEDYHKITAIFHDSVREVGLGLGQTFPDSTSWRNLQFIPPFIRIDYVFYSSELQAISAGAWHQSAGSDHRPTVASLILTSS